MNQTPATPPKPTPSEKMVGWYDPQQLFRTATDVLFSTLFGHHADYRRIEALGNPDIAIQDYSGRKEIWIDYTADVGDGWNPTYAVAYHLAQPELTLPDETGKQHKTLRGNVLVFGGDGVYPVANRASYRKRLVLPYETALPLGDAASAPDLYAIPGNHDWYDSLVSFTRLFCGRNTFAGWNTRQTRSYFALKLPHGWWLLGTDIQLDSDIDTAQVNYFREVASRMQPHDRVILCNAEPHWIFAKIYGHNDSDCNESNLAFLENVILENADVKVFLAGDLHHYRRHEGPGQVQKITAGGGGAFLHPTHGPDVSELDGNFQHKKSFPDKETSRSLTWRNFRFPWLTPRFGSLTAVLYLLTAWAVKTDIGRYGWAEWKTVLWQVLHSTMDSPVTAFWAVALFGGFLLFTDTSSKAYRIVGGITHGLAHLIALFLIGWGSSVFTTQVLPSQAEWPIPMLVSGTLIFVGGWIVGSWILGVYLYISLNWFGRHSNEAFSSLAIEDWKNFLRMKIDEKGDLTIYPVGIRTVPKAWRDGGAVSRKSPDDKRATDPELIERPIEIRGKT